jgi:FKBP-type peptidyl-prolyl cis-trans isomerase FkpA
VLVVVAIALLVWLQRSDNGSAPDNGASAQTGTQRSVPPAPTDPALTKVPTSITLNGKTIALRPLSGGEEYRDIVVGNGREAEKTSIVQMLYTGTLLNGAKFDSTADRNNQPFVFMLGIHQVIAGWDIGIPGMRVGGERVLVIPASLAYGSSSPSADIPPNATLVFDVKLVALGPPIPKHVAPPNAIHLKHPSY